MLGLIAALIVLMVPKADATTSTSARILPLGDSITYGYEHGSYRTTLWTLLVEDHGRDIDFVGSRSDGPSTLPDRDHEGHSGWRIDEIEAKAPAWVQQHDPDVVLLHIGTNDMIQGASADLMAARLETLLATLVAAGPDMTVIVASIIPLHEPDERWRAYNAAVADVVAALRQDSHDVVLADIAGSGISGREDIPDGVHPGPSGYAKMANVWSPLVLEALEALEARRP